jgi:hypothetical protein
MLTLHREKFLWSAGTIVSLAVIFILLLEVNPNIKADKSAGVSVEATTESAPSESTGAPPR